MVNFYEVEYKNIELRRAGVIANNEDEAKMKFINGEYEDDDGIEHIDNVIESVDIIEENISEVD